jgi:hypothetical protein
MLRTGGGDVSLFVSVPPRPLADAAGAQGGWLIWHPKRDRRRKKDASQRLGARFVADSGWQMPGELTEPDADTAGRETGARTQLDDTSARRELVPSKGWLLVVPMWMTAVSVLCAVDCALMLWLPLPSWRIALGLAAPVALLAAFVVLSVRNASTGHRASAAASTNQGS